MQRKMAMALACTMSSSIVMLAGITPASAATPPCGSVVTESVILTADMDCTAQPGPALIVGANGVTIDLDDHTVRSNSENTGVDRGAIYNSGFDDVTIQNGIAQGDTAAVVLASGADGNHLAGLRGGSAGGAFIAIYDSSGALVEGISDAGTSNGHAVVLTRTSASTVRSLSNADGIELIDSSDNVIAGNQIGGSDVGAVRLGGTSSRNQIRNNRIDGSWIFLSGAGDGNVIADNTIRRAYSGITIEQGMAGTTVSGNTVSDGQMAGIRVAVGATGTVISGNTTRNIVGYSGEEDPSGSGILIANVNATVTNNESYANASFGIHAVSGVRDGGGNVAYSNGAYTQCVGVTCTAPDAVAPTVSTRTPAVNSVGAAVAANVTAKFSEAVQGVTTATFTLKDPAGTVVPGAVSYDTGTRVATINPNSSLAAGTKYTATLSGGATAIRDVAGNALITQSWSFTTATPVDTTPPTVSAKTPAAGATGVVAGSNVMATFSEAVQGVSGTTMTLKTSSGAAVAATVTYNATTRVATLDPTANLAAGTVYTATLTGGTSAIRDAASNPLSTVTWSFTAAAPAGDTTPPTVTTRSPAANATAVSVGGNVTATFSEPAQAVNGTTLVLKNAAGTTVAATVTYNSTSRVATLDPSANLAADTRYTATLTGGSSAIRDATGNALATTSWSFLTGPAPAVSSRTPASGATGVSRTANLTATFSEPVQAISATTVTVKTAAGAAVSATVAYNATTRVVTINPSATLAANTQYRVTLTGSTSAIRDTAGNPLPTTTWTFTTGS